MLDVYNFDANRICVYIFQLSDIFSKLEKIQAYTVCYKNNFGTFYKHIIFYEKEKQNIPTKAIAVFNLITLFVLLVCMDYGDQICQQIHVSKHQEI